jgi:hypothetical protein
MRMWFMLQCPWSLLTSFRYRSGKRRATGFPASAVTQVVRTRMVQHHQMRWTQHGAHPLLQVRVQVRNDDLRATFGAWYPGVVRAEPALAVAA